MRSRLLLVSSLLSLALISIPLCAQTASPNKPAAQAPAAPAARPQTAPAPATTRPPQREVPPAPEPDKVAPTAPVISFQGLCSDPAAPKTPDCATVITREQFEKMANALDPNMTEQGRSSLATQYAQILVMAADAERHGVAQSPRTLEVLRFVRSQVLANLYNQQLQEQAKESSPDAAQKFYDAHQGDFQEVTLRRIVIPRNVPPDAKKLSEDELAALATSLNARARAGEDFDKLQHDAYEAENLKTAAPPTALGAQRRSGFAPAHLAMISRLKPGDVSGVLPDSAGYFMYKLEAQRLLPFEQVKADVERALQTESYQGALADAFSGVKASLNQQYFGAFASVNFPGRPATAAPAAAPTPPPTQKPPTTPQ